MKLKLITGLIAALALALLLSTGVSNGYSQQQSQGSAADQRKIEALNDAYKNGLLTQQEYDAKLQALNGGADTRYSGAEVGMKTVQIYDPLLGMNFFSMTIPSNWAFDGGMVHQTSCSLTTSEFHRASSPDGLTGYKVLPRLDWAWSNNPEFRPKSDSDCMTHEGEIPAADFLQYVVKMLHVDFVRDVTDPADVQRMREGMARQNNLTGYRATEAEVAQAVTKFSINSISEEELVVVTVTCNQRVYQAFVRSIVGTCGGQVELMWAPAGKLEATVKMLRSTRNMTWNPAWRQRWSELNEEHWASIAQQGIAQNKAFYTKLRAETIANGTAFRQDMDVRYQQHQEMTATIQQGYDRYNARQIEGMNANQHMADDWCDYALGVQKRYDPNTGELSKTNSAFNYDWINSEGKHLQSNDVNFNPNGMGTGNWTLTANVY